MEKKLHCICIVCSGSDVSVVGFLLSVFLGCAAAAVVIVVYVVSVFVVVNFFMALINYFLVAYEIYLNYLRVANCCCCACNCINIVSTHFCPTVWVVACVGVKGKEGIAYV